MPRPCCVTSPPSLPNWPDPLQTDFITNSNSGSKFEHAFKLFLTPESCVPAAGAPAVRSSRVRAKHRRRRGEILEAALRAFRDQGYHATTLDDIAAQLGVRKTALYHYFPDKEAILYACHRESLAELSRILAGARALDSPQERLSYVIRGA